MVKDYAASKIGDLAEEVNNLIQQEIGKTGIPGKIANEEPLDEAEKEFLANLNALSFEANRVLNADEQDLVEAAEDLEEIIDIKKNAEEDAMVTIENGLRSFEGHLQKLIEDLEGESENVENILRELQHDQEGILRGVEEMIEVDRELSNKSDLDRVLLRLVKHSAEAGSFLKVCAQMYGNRSGSVEWERRSSENHEGSIEDTELHRIDDDEAHDVVGDRLTSPTYAHKSSKENLETLIENRRTRIRNWAAEAEGEGFASEVANQMQIGDEDISNISDRIRDAFTGHSFMRTAEKVEELLEIEQNLDANVRSRVLSFLHEDSSLEEKINDLETKMGKYYADKDEALEKYVGKLDNILKAVDLTRKVLIRLKRFEENDLEEEEAFEKFLEGRISAENFESVIEEHTQNRKREISLKRFEDDIEDIEISWSQPANNH